MAAAEPSLARFGNPVARYFAATRPAFLTVTLAGALIGLGSAAAGGVGIDVAKAVLTVLFALVAHAGANVVNDYHDALNGSDAQNTDRQFPFTGGSRFIQNGVLTLAQTRHFGHALLAAVIPAGLWLTVHSAPGLVLIGLAGLFVAWAYSAPPFRLMSRGMGEGAITAGWLLVVLGTDFVQRGSVSALPLFAGLPFALLVAAILYINGFPDARADAAAGKHTLVVRLGAAAPRMYAVLTGAAYGSLAIAIAADQLPAWCALALLPAPLSFAAARELQAHAATPAKLVPAIQKTLAAAHLNGVLLAGSLALSRFF